MGWICSEHRFVYDGEVLQFCCDMNFVKSLLDAEYLIDLACIHGYGWVVTVVGVIVDVDETQSTDI